MKKKTIIIICILIAVILLFPLPLYYKDGGTVEYKAILYSVTNVHARKVIKENEESREYYEGIVVEILGIRIFNNVE